MMMLAAPVMVLVGGAVAFSLLNDRRRRRNEPNPTMTVSTTTTRSRRSPSRSMGRTPARR